jgi:mRNA interferase MazF
LIQVSALKIASRRNPCRCRKNDFALSQITSKSYADTRAIEINAADFAEGLLPLTSYARPTKLFTANESLFVTQVGELTEISRKKIGDAISDLLNESFV